MVGNDKLTVGAEEKKGKMNNEWKESQQNKISAFNRETKEEIKKNRHLNVK